MKLARSSQTNVATNNARMTRVPTTYHALTTSLSTAYVRTRTRVGVMASVPGRTAMPKTVTEDLDDDDDDVAVAVGARKMATGILVHPALPPAPRTTIGAGTETTGAAATAMEAVVVRDVVDGVASEEVAVVPAREAVPPAVNVEARADAINIGLARFCPAMKSLKGHSKLSLNCTPRDTVSSAVRKRTMPHRSPTRSFRVLWLRNMSCVRAC